MMAVTAVLGVAAAGGERKAQEWHVGKIHEPRGRGVLATVGWRPT